ncbi:MAG TPA: tetratricopeptide repeat protein [Polyangia bacterium]
MIALVVAPVAARAQNDDSNPAIEKITALNKKALDAYNDLEFEESRKLLKQALDLCASAGLDKHPVAARTHIHMGVVLIAAKQQDLGIKQFKTAIEIEPEIQVTKALANPEILEAFKAAGADATPAGGDSGGQPAGGDTAKPAPPEEVKGIQLNPPARGKRGKAIPLVVTIGADVTGYTKVLIEYRPEGAPEYLEREMKKSGNKYVGEIPADATEGNLVSYYVEADNDDENADSIATSGSEERPYNVSISGGSSGDDTGDGGCQGDDCDEDEGEAGPPLFIGLMGGFGYGFTTGNGEINDHNKVNPGFAPASVAQIAPEVGYFITPNFRLSLQFRYQIVSGTTPLNLDKYLTPAYLASYPHDIDKCGADHLCSTRTKSALAVLARGTWLFGAGTIRPYFSLAVGGGQIRHLVKFDRLLGKVCGAMGDQTCVDTVLSGPIFAGPGAGVLFALSPNFGLLVDLTSVLGFPNFTYNFDLNGGVALRF